MKLVNLEKGNNVWNVYKMVKCPIKLYRKADLLASSFNKRSEAVKWCREHDMEILS